MRKFAAGAAARRFLTISTSLLALTAGLPAVASAQDRPLQPDAAEEQAQDDDAKVDDIIVTGTQIRGVAPVGTNVVAVDREEVQATGASNATDLLASIPQLANFNSVPSTGTNQAQVIVRPSIRGIGGGAGGSATLVLVNGHRLVGAGVIQSVPDPSVISPAIIERVEVVPDGGSSIYGSDAIGGVINFITKRTFEGLEVSARYGFGDDYDSRDVNVTVGKSWEGGNAYLSYGHAERQNLLRLDRDYAAMYRPDQGGTDFRSANCTPGNVTVGSTNYTLPGFVAAPQQRCDINEYLDIVPAEQRDTLFGSFRQTINDRLDLEVTGYFANREVQPRAAQTVSTGVITSANPYFRRVGAETSQTVLFGYENVFGASRVSHQTLRSYGITPILRWNVDDNWQIRAQANLGRSTTEALEDTINAGAVARALAGTTLATALNPYNPAASAGPVLAEIENFENLSYSAQELAEARVVAEGAILTTGAGEWRLAAGAEFRTERLEPKVASGRRGENQNLRTTEGSRDVTAVFAEIFVPVVADGPMGFRSLDLTASARYDSYSDFGETTNPKVGFSYRPVSDLVVRGNYGTSFNAPTLADASPQTIDARAEILANSTVRTSTSPAADLNRRTIRLAGGNPNLTPEEATTYSIGADWKPDAIPGLSASLTYFNIQFENVIATAPFGNAGTLFGNPSYAPFYVINPTIEQTRAAIGGLRLDGAGSIEELYANGQSPYIIIDARRANLGQVDLDGLDFNIAYRRATSWGGLSASLGGTYMLNRESKAVATATPVDDLANGTRDLTLTGTAGVTFGDLLARVSVSYGGGYPVLNVVNQTEVDAFTTVDAFFSYDFGDRWGLDGLEATLNIDNITDEEPPFFNNATGYANGSTFGRTYTIGLIKRF